MTWLKRIFSQIELKAFFSSLKSWQKMFFSLLKVAEESFFFISNSRIFPAPKTWKSSFSNQRFSINEFSKFLWFKYPKSMPFYDDCELQTFWTEFSLSWFNSRKIREKIVLNLKSQVLSCFRKMNYVSLQTLIRIDS